MFGDNHPTRNMPADMSGVLETEGQAAAFGPGSAPWGNGGTIKRQSRRSGANSWGVSVDNICAHVKHLDDIKINWAFLQTAVCKIQKGNLEQG